MKTNMTLAAILVAATSATAVPVFASTGVEVETTNIRSYQMGNRAIRDHGGLYRMDDGTTLPVFREGTKFFAELDDASRVELRAVNDAKFVTATGKTELRFVNDGASKVVLSRAASSNIQLAQLAHSTTSIQ